MNARQFSGMKTLSLATALALGTLGASAAMAGQVYTDALTSRETYSQFIVQFKAESFARTNVSSASRVLASFGARSGVTLEHSRRLAIGADVFRIEGKRMSADEANKFMQSIAENPDVEYIQPDAMMRALYTPNDSRYGEQWHYLGAPGGMNLPGAWDLATGSGVVVAVIDTGITAHSDLSANIVAGYDFISDSTAARDGNGRDNNPQDEGDWFTGSECGVSYNSNSSWHGTHVAGTIAAVSNNASGVAGVAFNARVQPIRVLGKCGGSLSDIADAIVWASGGSVSGIPSNPTPAKVINMSLGGSGACDATYQNAINSAVSRGTVVVVAAGNSNANASSFRPASCNNVINVAALDREGNRASYSNYGTIIDLAAPGGETAINANGVLSTLNSGTTTPGSATYAFYQGTSMAAPHVAGLAALMLSRTSSLTPAQIESTMKTNVRAITGSCSGGCGAGAADATRTLQALSGTGNVAPTANFSFTSSGLTASFSDSSSDSDGSIASRSWNFGDGTSSTATSPSKTYSAAGTYSVTLTVTDNGGLTNSKTSSVTVASSGGGTVLSNGVAVTGLSAAKGTSLNYTMVVPAGATGLKFVMAGGSGDADMYVKFGSAPTDTSYDCRPYVAGNSETCNIATAQAGTYYVRMKAYSAFSGVSITGSYSAGGGGGASFFQNTADYTISDRATVDSPITVSGRSGNAPSNLQVAVRIIHTYQGDLKVDLVAPDGSLYNIHNRTGGGTDNIIKTVTINASSEVANGTWKLRVQDAANGDTGYIDSWSMQF